MRFHGNYPLFQTWLDLPESATLVRADRLAVVRFEPVTNHVRGAAVLDLLFSDGERVAAVPYVCVTPEMLLERERTPMVWPQAASALGWETLDELERLILPWLESHALARQANNELVRRFSDAIAEERFEAARAAGFLGAATYAGCMIASAPYVYASRFVPEQRVAVRDARGGTGAALLAPRAQSVRADLGSSDLNALAAQWFGRNIFGPLEDRPYDVCICENGASPVPAAVQITLDSCAPDALRVEVATPVPTDVLISFDPEDASAARVFGVHAPEPLLRTSTGGLSRAAVGGSAGTIVLLMREGFERSADADVDAAHALASRLRAEGFHAELASPSALADDASADLVHAFSVESDAAAVLERFHRRGVPVVISANTAPDADEAKTAPLVTNAIFARTSDEGALCEHLELFERRMLKGAVSGSESEAAQGYGFVDAAIARSAPEEARLRDDFRFAGEIVRGAGYLAGETAEPQPIGGIVGTQPFVFVHAPVEWRTNLALLMRAAAPRRMPVVVAGAAVDVDALMTARSFAPDLLIHVPSPAPGQIEALYRSARVYADVSWFSRGLHRVWRAAFSGCSLVLSRRSCAAELWPSAAQADPASVSSLGAALERAWAGDSRIDAGTPPDPFSSIISAYAAAQNARQLA